MSIWGPFLTKLLFVVSIQRGPFHAERPPYTIGPWWPRQNQAPEMKLPGDTAMCRTGQSLRPCRPAAAPSHPALWG